MRLGAALIAEPAMARVGVIASKNGKAIAVPRPFKTVRREIISVMAILACLGVSGTDRSLRFQSPKRRTDCDPWPGFGLSARRPPYQSILSPGPSHTLTSFRQ